MKSAFVSNRKTWEGQLYTVAFDRLEQFLAYEMTKWRTGQIFRSEYHSALSGTTGNTLNHSVRDPDNPGLRKATWKALCCTAAFLWSCTHTSANQVFKKWLIVARWGNPSTFWTMKGKGKHTVKFSVGAENKTTASGCKSLWSKKKGQQIIIDLIIIIIFALLRSDGDACRLSLLMCLESMVGLEGFALWWMTGFVPLSQNTKCPGPLVARPFIPSPFFLMQITQKREKK